MFCEHLGTGRHLPSDLFPVHLITPKKPWRQRQKGPSAKSECGMRHGTMVHVPDGISPFQEMPQLCLSSMHYSTSTAVLSFLRLLHSQNYIFVIWINFDHTSIHLKFSQNLAGTCVLHLIQTNAAIHDVSHTNQDCSRTNSRIRQNTSIITIQALALQARLPVRVLYGAACRSASSKCIRPLPCDTALIAILAMALRAISDSVLYCTLRRHAGVCLDHRTISFHCNCSIVTISAAAARTSFMIWLLAHARNRITISK